jgi:ATP-binding protein involved in chromosome partitioning
VGACFSKYEQEWVVGKSSVTSEQVLNALSKVIEPELHRDLVSLNMIRDVQIADETVSFTVMLTTPACPLKNEIESEVRAAVLGIPGVEQVNITMDANVPTDKRILGRLDLDLRNTIAISSGKGGVGKSTVAVNLAVSLAQNGAQVGLLDADIHGPNIPLMMGLEHMPPPKDKKLVPPDAFGVKVMSMAFLVPPGQPVIWRGPMLHSAIRQFFSDVLWGDLDYMIIDLPPGTGDAQLSLAQSVPLTGGIIVTTPQEVALIDARKGLATFRQLEVPVLGVVENMGAYTDPQTGSVINFFGEGGGERLAQEYDVPFLGSIPLDPLVRVGSDNGRPVIVDQPDAPAAQAFAQIAKRVAARVSVLSLSHQDAIPLQVIGE